MTVEETLNLAMERHRAGRLGEAHDLFRQVLAGQPNHAEALHALGLLARQQGRRDEALQLIRRAVEIKPSNARYHLNLGVVLDELGRPDEAIAAYRKAVELKPNFAGALCNLGRALTKKDELREAIAACRQAIAFEPNMAEAHQNLGGALFRAQCFTDAADALRQAAALRPDSPELLNELGTTLLEIHAVDESIAAFRRAIALVPNLAEAHNNLGAAYLEQRNYDQAVAEFRYAATVRPNFVDAYNNLGNALRSQGELDQSITALRQAVAIKPDSVESLTSLGSAFYAKGDFDQAIILYQAALAIRPDHPTANWNTSLTHLIKGDLQRGWPLYQWRWKLKEFRGRTYPSKPLWDGGDLEGRSILLHAEQGFGDAIHFIRYLPLVAKRGGKIILAAHVELHRLFKEMDQPVRQWVAPHQPLPDCDVHCPLMSLPMVLKTTLANIPAKTPYLRAGVILRERWRQRLAEERRLKVGLVWAGRPTHANERDRSLALEKLAPLATAPGVRFVSLQKGAAGMQVAGGPMEMLDWTHELEDFADTAALIANLDLVISVDTAVAHLAGALGKPVWLLLPFVPDWRWMLDREDSPWYPKARLFRQPKIGDWETPIARVAEMLATTGVLRSVE